MVLQKMPAQIAARSMEPTFATLFRKSALLARGRLALLRAEFLAVFQPSVTFEFTTKARLQSGLLKSSFPTPFKATFGIRNTPAFPIAFRFHRKRSALVRRALAASASSQGMSMSLPFETVDWCCELCGMALKSVVLPVHHDCPTLKKPCQFRGESIREIKCTKCNGHRLIPVLACEIHGETVLRKIADDKLYELQLMSCERCIRRNLGFSPPASDD